MPLYVEPMSEGLLRQRRNLMVISLLIVFLQQSGLEINQINIFGISFKEVPNQQVLYKFIWLSWFYFLFRYYQHFAQEGIEKLNESLSKTIDNLSISIIKEVIIQKHPNTSTKTPLLSILKKHSWIVHGQETAKDPDDFGQHRVNNYKFSFPKNRIIMSSIKGFAVICIN